MINLKFNGRTVRAVLVIPFILQIFLASQTQAESEDKLVLIPSAALSIQSTEFERLDRLAVGGNIDWNINQVLEFTSMNLELALTSVFNAFYVKTSVDVPLTETESSFDSRGVITSGSIADLATTAVDDVNINRNSQMITVGYNLAHGWSVFSGFRVASIEFQMLESASITEVSPSSLQQNYTSYNERGMFFGGGWSYPFDKWGDIAMVAAYANLDLTTQTSATLSRMTTFSGARLANIVPKISGSMKGLSYSVKWFKRLSENMALFADVKVHQYELDQTAGAVQIFSGNTDTLEEFDLVGTTTITETVQSFSVGINYLL